jgi:outer membrane protein TolC
MTAARPVLATLLAAAPGLPTQAQNPPPQNPPPQNPPVQADPQAKAGDALYGAGKGLEITLDGACEIALQQNLGFAEEVLNTDLALYAYRGSYGTYDWLFHAGAGVTDTKGQAQSVFGGEDVNTQSGSLDMTRFFDTGGTLRTAFSRANTKTNSSITTINPSTHDLVSLTYTQPILRGAWREYNTAEQREAELVWRQQVENERATRQKLLLDVSIAYWDLVAARDQLEVKVSSVDLAKAQVEQEQRRLDAGVGTRLDVLQAETQVATREQERLQADVQVRGAADVLRALIFPGKDPDRWETAILTKTQLPDEVSTADVPAWTSALDLALDQRAELHQQRLVIEIMTLRHDLRRSDKRPFLDLELGAVGEGFSGDPSTSFDDAVAFNFPTLSARVNLSIPIGNTSAKWALEAAWVNLRRAKLEYDQIESRIAAEVRLAVRQLLYQSESVKAARKSIDLAREQLKAEEARRQVEITTNFQVLQFQQDLVAAISSERAARANFAKALVVLKHAQGVLGDRP